MISRLFEHEKLSKAEKRTFVPFVNERNFMGTLLPVTEKVDEERASELQNTKNIALIQNLRKSTKEYYFDKKYEKMARRLRNIQDSMHKHEPDYDEEVAHCIETLNYAKTFTPSRNHENHRYYVDLKDALNDRIACIKHALIAKIHSHRDGKNRKNNLEAQFDQHQRCVSKPPRESPERSISREVFRQVGKNSQYMTDFSNEGLKYRHLVQSKKINPWKKWYVKQNIEIFPGQTVTLKKLQKTIY